MYNDPTEEMMTKSFLEFFNELSFPVEVIDKKRSLLMKLANLFILLTNKLGITDISNFMESYITTIGSRVYGSPKFGWTTDMLPNSTLIHELTHAAGFYREGFLKYSLKYLFSKKWRARYESYCVQAEMMYNPSLRTVSQLEIRTLHFLPYGIDIKTMNRELIDRYDELAKNNPQLDPAGVIGVYNLWRSEHLSSTLPEDNPS